MLTKFLQIQCTNFRNSLFRNKYKIKIITLKVTFCTQR